MNHSTLIRLRQTAKLEKMIKENYSYEEILAQSKKLDEFIVHEMKKINNIEILLFVFYNKLNFITDTISNFIKYLFNLTYE